MLKNITLSAEEKLIEKARKKCSENNTSLNEVFRQWLANYAKEKNLIRELDEYVEKVGYSHSGRSFHRDELNER